MSVRITNEISAVMMKTVCGAASVGWAASLLGSPIGAMGGAIFGAVSSLAHVPLQKGVSLLLNTDHPSANTQAKTLSFAIPFFASYGAAWAAVLGVVRVSLTLSHVINLMLVSFLTSIAVNLLMACFSPSTRREITADTLFA